MINISDYIKFAMSEQNVNISELANLTGLSITYTSKLLRNEKRWNEDTLTKTLKVLNLEFEIKPIRKKATANA